MGQRFRRKQIAKSRKIFDAYKASCCSRRFRDEHRELLVHRHNVEVFLSGREVGRFKESVR